MWLLVSVFCNNNDCPKSEKRWNQDSPDLGFWSVFSDPKPYAWKPDAMLGLFIYNFFFILKMVQANRVWILINCDRAYNQTLHRCQKSGLFRISETHCYSNFLNAFHIFSPAAAATVGPTMKTTNRHRNPSLCRHQSLCRCRHLALHWHLKWHHRNQQQLLDRRPLPCHHSAFPQNRRPNKWERPLRQWQGQRPRRPLRERLRRPFRCPNFWTMICSYQSRKMTAIKNVRRTNNSWTNNSCCTNNSWTNSCDKRRRQEPVWPGVATLSRWRQLNVCEVEKEQIFDGGVNILAGGLS